MLYKAAKEAEVFVFYRFFHLNLVDLDAEQFVFKIHVEVEAISVFHVFPSRVLVEDSGFPAGQGLQCALQLSLLCGEEWGMKQPTL